MRFALGRRLSFAGDGIEQPFGSALDTVALSPVIVLPIGDAHDQAIALVEAAEGLVGKYAVLAERLRDGSKHVRRGDGLRGGIIYEEVHVSEIRSVVAGGALNGQPAGIGRPGDGAEGNGGIVVIGYLFDEHTLERGCGRRDEQLRLGAAGLGGGAKKMRIDASEGAVSPVRGDKDRSTVNFFRQRLSVGIEAAQRGRGKTFVLLGGETWKGNCDQKTECDPVCRDLRLRRAMAVQQAFDPDFNAQANATAGARPKGRERLQEA